MGWAFFSLGLLFLLILSRVEIYYLDKGSKCLEEILKIQEQRVEHWKRAYSEVLEQRDEAYDVLERALKAVKAVTNVTPTDGGGV